MYERSLCRSNVISFIVQVGRQYYVLKCIHSIPGLFNVCSLHISNVDRNFMSTHESWNSSLEVPLKEQSYLIYSRTRIVSRPSLFTNFQMVTHCFIGIIQKRRMLCCNVLFWTMHMLLSFHYKCQHQMGIVDCHNLFLITFCHNYGSYFYLPNFLYIL